MPQGRWNLRRSCSATRGSRSTSASRCSGCARSRTSAQGTSRQRSTTSTKPGHSGPAMRGFATKPGCCFRTWGSASGRSKHSNGRPRWIHATHALFPTSAPRCGRQATFPARYGPTRPRWRQNPTTRSLGRTWALRVARWGGVTRQSPQSTGRSHWSRTTRAGCLCWPNCGGPRARLTPRSTFSPPPCAPTRATRAPCFSLRVRFRSATISMPHDRRTPRRWRSTPDCCAHCSGATCSCGWCRPLRPRLPMRAPISSQGSPQSRRNCRNARPGWRRAACWTSCAG